MYQLRPEYQEPIHQATVAWCKSSREPAFVTASVGSGKTINIAFMCKHITERGGKVLVLARQGELIEQNAADAWSIGVKTSIFSASLGKKSTVFNCVMGTEGTVSNHLADVFMRWVPDAILIDECHMVGFDDYETQYMKIINHFKALNPKLRIIGYTGSPYRGTESILGDFWKKELYNVGTMQLITLGYLVPPVFGFGDDEHHYDLSEFKPSGYDGTNDFTAKELAAMGRKLTKDATMTQLIMEQVKAAAANRNGVLITCASKKHCDQVAECLPAGTWGIVTDDTSTKNRKAILDKAKTGEIKYVIQIGCLTTGVNVPLWDVCVILRKIGSLTLLIQLTGRVLRTLKPEQLERGITKTDALVLDYTDTFESIGDVFDDPIVNMAVGQKKKLERDNAVECPECGALNSKFARRCIGVSDSGVRCEYFWQFRTCESCNTKNDITSKSCRCCDAVLIDPNVKLLHKAYTDADFKPVLSMQALPGKGDTIRIEYLLDSTYSDNGIERPEVAREYLSPFSPLPHIKAIWYRWLMQHTPLPDVKNKIIRNGNAAAMCEAINALAEKPIEITHRINAKGFSVINRKKFKNAELVEQQHDDAESHAQL